MMLETLIIEKLDRDGVLKTFVMRSSAPWKRITVAFPEEYTERRFGPFHLYDPEDEERYKEGFAKCRARKLGTDFFRVEDSTLWVKTAWQGIPTDGGSLSYYAFSLPKHAIPRELSVTDPRSGREYRRVVVRDDAMRCYTVYLECSSRYGTFDFTLECSFEIDRTQFRASHFTDQYQVGDYHHDVDSILEDYLVPGERKKLGAFMNRGTVIINTATNGGAIAVGDPNGTAIGSHNAGTVAGQDSGPAPDPKRRWWARLRERGLFVALFTVIGGLASVVAAIVAVITWLASIH